MGPGMQPGAPPDPSVGYQDPYGSGGKSSVEYGMCPIDLILEDEVEEVKKLSYAKLHAFDMSTHGQFFWNFRTELETRWDYLQVVLRGSYLLGPLTEHISHGYPITAVGYSTRMDPY